MKILAIESSCDETAAAVVEDGRRVLSSVIASQIQEHILYGGVVPEIASRRHVEAISGLVSAALRDAGLAVSDIDAIAVTHSPGLIGALLVGVNFAKGLAYSAGLPLIPVHHLRSHVAANYISQPKLTPPFLCLVVSGGHTHLIDVKDYTEFEVIGRTRDDAAGEALDKAARAMGLPYPGGLNMDKLSGNAPVGKYSLPIPKVSGSEYDFSFSGLKTAVLNLLHNASQKGEEVDTVALGADFMNTISICLADKVKKVIRDRHFKKLVLAGGVSANSVLRRHMKELCENESIELFMPEISLCGDNAAMVGSQAYYEFLAGKRAGLDLNASASMPIE